MKKILFVLSVLLVPFVLFSQPMDTTMIYHEDFDGANVRMNTTTATNMGGSLGDWRVVGTGITYDNWSNLPLSKSAPKSFHSPVYLAAAFSEATLLDTIATSAQNMDVKHIYLDFDHICKVHNLDNAAIYYNIVEGFNSDGSYIWSGWKLLNFSSNSPFYYGDAKSTTSSAISGGVFNHSTYSIWNSSNMAAQPTNAWWRHEMIDITSFLQNDDGTFPPFFQLKFRLRKTSSSSSGTEACAGWYVDNVNVILSNCELIRPTITMQSPYYYNVGTNFTNQTGPFNIKAQLFDNDTINTSAVKFSYEINSGETVVMSNDGAFTSNVLNANGHTINAQWSLPNICYQDTIYYHIYMEDTHGSKAQFDTFLVAHHNQSNIQQNDIRLDSLNTFPHCLITGTPQNVDLYFRNRSDAVHSPNASGMISGTFTMEVRNEAGTLTHTSNHTWNGDICFDIPASLSLGQFTPTHGYNYVTVYVNSRNGVADGYHANDTLRITAYSCDSLMSGHYTVGGTNPDFADMEAVRNSLEFCGLGGPVVFHLRPGTYSDFDFAETYLGQSAVNTITFEGDDVNSVIITNNHNDNGTNTYGAVTLVNVRDYIFKNLTIQGNNSATASRGVHLRGAGSANILFDGCKITAYNTQSTAVTSAAVSRVTAATTGTGDTITFRNCTMIGGNFGVHYVGSNARKNYIIVDSCDVTSCYRGIYTNYTNSIISNNHVHQVYSSNPQNFTGIYVNYVNGADINGNTVDSIYKMEYGVYLAYATLETFNIRNNHIKVGNGSNALYVTNSSSTGNVYGYIYNNEIILYPVVAANSYAANVNNSNNLYFINNSILAKSDAPYSNSAALYISNGNNNTYIYNNILLNQVVCSDNTNYPLYLNGNATATGSYNDFNSESGVIAYKTVARNTIAELENAISTLTNNISVLPPFANSSTQLLPTSFTGLECMRNSAVTTDIRGINRSAVTYIGAYADQIPAIDAALTAMVSPALGECPELAYDITVEITNKGAETINFASGNAKVSIYSQALNLNQEVNLTTGTVAALNTINQVLAQNVAIPVNQVVDFRFIISTDGDNNHSNDTLYEFFTLETIVPDYEENFSNGTQDVWTIEQVAGAGNWTYQNGEGVNPAIAPVYGTGRLYFNAKGFANNTKSRAILPVVTLTGTTNPIFEMWFAHDNSSNKSGEGVNVKVSVDGGITYTDIIPQGQNTALVKRYLNTATTPTWKLYTYDLSNFIQNECIYIAIEATGQGGNNINIDRIRVRNLQDNDIAVSKIYGQGETPTNYSMKGVVSALVRNEGAQAQNNIDVYLKVTGATEQWNDTLTIPTLAYNTETLITFPDHNYNVAEVKDVEVRVRDDQKNNNNAAHWRMVTTDNVTAVADSSNDIILLGDYNAVIRPCVRYKSNQSLAVTDVRYYYDQTYIADPENGFRAFVADASGNILAKSDVINFNSLQMKQWNTIPIQNFALTNTDGEFYVGLEMLAHGNYLCAQVETPLRDSTFYYLNNGSYVPQNTGRFMIGAVVDTPFVNDLAILSLENPISNCDLGHENLKVKLTNNGTTEIVPPIQLHYTINGGGQVDENFTDTLYSHQTTIFTFSSIFDFTNNLIDQDSNYVIKVWATKLAADRLQYNDTLNTTVVSRGKSPMPIVPDTIIVNYHTSATLSAQLPASISEGVIGWYASTGYESWNLLEYSNTHTTPLIYFDTTFYATASPGTLTESIVGTGTTSTTNPFVFTAGYSRGRSLYLEEEIGGHGTISALALNVKTAQSAAAANGIPVKIYMKCTNDNVFSSTSVDWNSEIEGATLVYDDRAFFSSTGWYNFDITPFDFTTGNLIIFTETNCADYCTGSGTQCNNCGTYVTGANSYPAFNSTNTTATMTQYKSGNTAAQLSGAYTNVSRRINTKFTLVDLECGSEKAPIRLHVPDIPNYDVETQELVYPTTSCALYDEHIQVQVKNMLNIPIPANKVVVHAIFNGTEITQTVADTFASEEVKIVEFATPFDFSAPTANKTFNYTIFTTLNDETIVYGGNDTITGSFVSTKTAYLPDSLVYTGNYNEPFEILAAADRSTAITQYYFYNNFDDATPFHTTTTAVPYHTTQPLYDTAVFWASGKTQTSNCITKRIKVIINVFRPQYDLSTDDLIYPQSFQCATLSPQIKVLVTNTDTTSTSVIPAGTFEVKADFTGSANISGTNTISTPISSLITDTVTFANGLNLGSATQNRIYQYLIYTRPTDASMQVYTLNDTIKGTRYIPALPNAPQNLTFTVPYGGTQTVTPSSSALNHFYFYENSNASEILAEGNSFTTDQIFEPTTYYYSGRVESDDFKDDLIIGNQSSSAKAAPMSFTSGHSYAKILYNKEDMNGYAGRIDSISFYVGVAEANGVGIPMKFWLMNGENKAAIATSNTSINWNNEVANATLVYEGDMVWNTTGWVGFQIDGGFDYTGEGLYLYVEHNCGSTSCVNTYGMSPTPTFKNTSTGTNKKTLTKNSSTALSSATSFTVSADRWNTKFSMNYTCESPLATITINTTVPQHDVGVTEIVAPVTQSNTYSANEPVTVKIKNFGTSAASNFPVSYKFDNNAPVTQNYTGSLAAGATATMTFTTNCDLTSVYLPVPFIAYTGLTTDTYHNNDTTLIYLSSSDPCMSRPLSSSTGAHITNVSIAALNNGTAAPFTNHSAAPGNGMYSDFTETIEPTELIVGQEYTLSVSHAFTESTTKTVYKRAYIDYNRNGEFETSEMVFSQNSIAANAANATSSVDINIPADADLGLTRMRVICATKSLTGPCEVYNADGETEDYAILLSMPMDVDLGVAKIEHPVGEVCADENAKIRVKIRNYGTQPQTLTADNSLTVTANVTGAANGTYTRTVTSGSIEPSTDMLVEIPNVNFSAQGDYNVAVQITYNGDQYLTNNSRSGVANVPNTNVLQLPFVEDFDSYFSLTSEVIPIPDTWEVESSASSYAWTLMSGASTNNGNNGGPGHDNTQSGIAATEQFGVYALVPGVNGTSNQSKWTALTSRCINLHYNDGFPVEMNFYKFFYGASNTDFNMDVQVGSGSYYQTVQTLTKADGEQTSVNSPWASHIVVFNDIDEVAKVRFYMTGQKNRIDPCIDDINIENGLPDMAVSRIVYPEDKSVSTTCLEINSLVRPQVEFYNNGHSTVNAFDVEFNVGTGNDITTVTEHIDHTMAPGESYIYQAQHEFTVTNITQNWEVKATVYIENDKNLYNNTKRVLSCTNVGIDDYEEMENVYLGQNEPNPAVSKARVYYSVPQADKVTFEILSASGQVLYTTVEEAYAGKNFIDLNLSSFAAGIYYYTLHYKDIVLTKKMIIEK